MWAGSRRRPEAAWCPVVGATPWRGLQGGGDARRWGLRWGQAHMECSVLVATSPPWKGKELWPGTGLPPLFCKRVIQGQRPQGTQPSLCCWRGFSPGDPLTLLPASPSVLVLAHSGDVLLPFSHVANGQMPCCCWWPPGMDRPRWGAGRKPRTDTDAPQRPHSRAGRPRSPWGRSQKRGPSAATASCPWAFWSGCWHPPWPRYSPPSSKTSVAVTASPGLRTGQRKLSSNLCL
ncbi:hypothetical protein HJG60_010371 [Phyllostomus discolor]|uniref:Uncharacterized protein n=1 Tax=Phyllostomus discolor TaxID=89673 RepID=A0A834AWY9_9CHIR|nr:hypothetical protein HJG60_010371 [Phyllostomus discolor]